MRTDTELLDGLERIARSGDCPGVINDDNGHWAVSGDGIQTLPARTGEPFDCHTTFIVPSEAWHTSIRAAINAYLDDPCIAHRDGASHE